MAVQEKDDDAEDDGSVLSSLLDEMRPYVLRRVKAHVEKSVPPKEEIVVSVALAPLQKRYYRALYEKNVLMLAGTGRPVDGPSLMNLAMELRKCCNHPFLLKGVERQEEARLSGQTERERLVGACGKLQFLDKLLPRLFQESNRKVLIFSQFVMMLDVLSDYLRSAKYAHGRVDGGVTGRDRQKQIDQFAQQGEGAVRVMLLSTRAGGVGINLVAADTVVVYDSDWNPHAAPTPDLSETAEAAVTVLVQLETKHSQVCGRDLAGNFWLPVTALADLGVDPETALRGTNEKFLRRFRFIEAALAERGSTPADSTLSEMDGLWNAAKAVERGRPA